MAIVPALGTAGEAAQPFAANCARNENHARNVAAWPVELVTRPSLTGSLPVVNMIGIVVVDDLARIAAKASLNIMRAACGYFGG